METRFDSYDELISLITDTLDRDDLVEFVPTWIRMAELRIQRDTKLRLRFTEDESTAQSMVADQDYVELPADAIEPRWIRILTQPISFVYIASAQEFQRWRRDDAGGVPKVMMARGLKLALAPTPTSALTYDICFYKGIPPLATGTQTNWLTSNAPDCLYLAALAAAQPWLDDEDKTGTWEALAGRAIQGLKVEEARARTGGGPLRIVPDNVV